MKAMRRWSMRSIFISPATRFKRLTASLQGLKHLYRYYRDIRANLSYPWLIRKEFPGAQIMIGGGAFTAFADQLIEKLPEGTIGILGEGEDAILKVIDGQPLDDERYILCENGRDLQRYEAGDAGLLDAPTVDLPYLTSMFPQFTRIRRRVHRRADANEAARTTVRSVCIHI